MQLDKFKEALELFRNQVINESKQNLRKIGKGGGTLELWRIPRQRGKRC
jgi:hypothetical protein